MVTPTTGPESPVQRESAISRLLDIWRMRRERIKRLNEVRSRPPDPGGGRGGMGHWTPGG